ncbi:MAG TPA: condensation domain-containing protein [Verrucomicrobiae bacterium]
MNGPLNAPVASEYSTRFSPEQWARRKPAYASGGPITIPPNAPMTFTEALRRRANQTDRGVTYVQREGHEEFQSYADLWREARCVLAGLRALGLKQGDRVILQIDSLRNHFTTFWACVLGGFTPVTVAVAPSYADKNGVVSKLWNTWKLLKGPLIITSAHLEKPIQGLASFMEMPDLRTTAVEPLKEFAPTDQIYDSKPEDLVFFQLTSGSTGVPKCIQETHRGIIHHIHGSQQFNGYKPENVNFNWLPVDHVVPILTSHLKDCYLGIAQVHVKSDVVLSDPLRWLDLMEKYRVTHSWCPNFGFKLVADRLAALDSDAGKRPKRTWDLSHLEFLMNAGEQVTLPVVKDFLERTAKFGIRERAMQPSFGMAEVCTCMTYQNDFGVATGAYRFKKSTLGGLMEFAEKDDPTAVTFVDLGPVVPGVEIRITDKENKVVPEGVVGRFQIRGAVVTPGYLYNDAANAEAFVGDGWFNSGDLGFILNGRLTLTGREKEMIIVRGANFYCYEIEDVVNGMEDVDPTFVSSSAVPDAETGTEALAVMFVPKPGRTDEELAALCKEIRAKVGSSLGITPAFVIPLEKSAFLKTTSGKIQRSQMKKNFEAGEYNAILERLKAAAKKDSAAAKDELEAKLVLIWRELLRTDEVGLKDNFFAAGGDSLLAARVIARVQDAFAVELPLHVLFNGAGTIEGMADQIRNRTSTKTTAPPISRRAERSWAPASLGQQRLWLLDQMNPGCPAYNVATIAKLSGGVNLRALEKAIGSLMAQHQPLRSRFEVMHGQVCQVFDLSAISVEVEQLGAADFEAIYKAAYKEAARGFDLHMGPLLRAKLFIVSGEESYLALTLHQTVIDGWSLKLMFEQLANFYEVHADSREVRVEPLSVEYGDYAAWQRDWLKGEALETQMNYWRKELAGELPEIDLPIDLARPLIQTHVGDTQVQRLPEDLSDALRDFAKEQGTTVFMAIIAAYQAFLSRVSGQDEVVIGTAIAGRGKTELEKMIGFFVSTVAMRASFLPNPSFAKLLAQTREKTVAAYEHQYAPFEKIVEEIQPVRNKQRTPIFQVWFGAWDALQEHRAGAITMTPVKVFMPGAQFELSLFAIERKEIELIWEYRTDLFLPETIEKFRTGFERLLRQMLRNPNQPLQTIFAMLNDEEYQERIREQSRLATSLKSARRKGLTVPGT